MQCKAIETERKTEIGKGIETEKETETGKETGTATETETMLLETLPKEERVELGG